MLWLKGRLKAKVRIKLRIKLRVGVRVGAGSCSSHSLGSSTRTMPWEQGYVRGAVIMKGRLGLGACNQAEGCTGPAAGLVFQL